MLSAANMVPVPNGVIGYRQEKDVAPNSGTETYVAMQLAIDNWRWAGVPFYLAHREAHVSPCVGNRHSL